MVPAGWHFSETGTGANTTYAAGTGSDNAGNTYSFGSTGSSERAFGGLLSGSVTPTVGASFANNTGSVINTLAISYAGEQWRLGAVGRVDRLDFQISTDATSLTTGTWSDVNTLDFTAPVTAGTLGAINGNSTGNRAAVSATVAGLSIPNGATFWVRWADSNASGADDGLAVDDFSLTASSVPVPTDPTGVGAANPGTLLAGNTTLLTVTVTPGANPTSAGLGVAADLTPIGGEAAQPFYDDGTNGDATAGDNTFSFSATVAPGTTPGAKSLTATITDNYPRSNTAAIPLTVKSPPSTTIVISEVDADPPLTGTDTANEWFELQNKTASAITLTNWTISDGQESDTIPTVVLGPSGRVIVAATSNGFADEHPGFAGTVLAVGGGSIGNGLANGGDRLILRDGSGVEIDCVSWGSNLSCLNPSAPAAGSGNTIQRDEAGTDTDTAADWTAAEPTPDGTANNGSTNPSGLGAANPNVVPQGGSTLLTVAVTPGSDPISTGLAVVANLSPIGGEGAQPFYDDGTNGDATAGDNTFSFSATVSAATATGSKSLPALITDAESRTRNVSISLTIVPPPPPPIAISQIQGSTADSPLVGQYVTTNGVVTARKSNGFFIQTPDGLDDGNDATSEGIFVFSSSPAAVGGAVTVTGTVIEFFNLTEIGGPVLVTVNSNNNPLPAPVTLTTSILNAAGSPDQLERFEGMRLHAAALRSVAPTNGFGETFTVLEGVARPMREPGIEISLPVPPDPSTNAPDCCIPRWDENPERIMVDSDGLAGSSAVSVTSNVTLSNVTGPLDFTFGDYKILPEAQPAVSAGMSAVAVPAPAADEFTVAGFNIEHYAGGATQRRKAALAIRNVMRSPDVIGHVEIANLASLQALADQVNSDAVAAGEPNPGYEARLIPFGNFDQHVGFLVKTSRVQINSVTQEREEDTFVNPNNNQSETLHDRPPLVLRATVDVQGYAPRPFIVVVNHLRSFIDTELVGGEGPRVRAKRKAQAESLAGLLQELQTGNSGTPVISVGDYNAYQFNDGYTDPIATLKGSPTADEQMVVDASPDLVNPNFFNLTDGLDAAEQYSFIFEGTPQALDHVLVNTSANSIFRRYVIARNNADFPEGPAFAADPTRPERNSDHDMPVAYFALDVDTDGDGTGDSVDTDDDGDGQSDADERACGSDPLNASSKSADNDEDNSPDCVDEDDDEDGVPDVTDNCDFTKNPNQEDFDGDGVGDLCGDAPPTNKDQCKNDGWMRWKPRFRNQGDCVSYTNTGK